MSDAKSKAYVSYSHTLNAVEARDLVIGGAFYAGWEARDNRCKCGEDD